MSNHLLHFQSFEIKTVLSSMDSGRSGTMWIGSNLSLRVTFAVFPFLRLLTQYYPYSYFLLM